ncbi:hypothetical protein IscW_ISCW019340, partial [Ixodes scapularis]
LTYSTVFVSSIFLPLTLTRCFPPSLFCLFLYLLFFCCCESVILGIFPAAIGCVPRRCIQ